MDDWTQEKAAPWRTARRMGRKPKNASAADEQPPAARAAMGDGPIDPPTIARRGEVWLVERAVSGGVLAGA